MSSRHIPRRVFVREGALALLALGVPPAWLTSAVLGARPPSRRTKTLVCIFQRGAVDGLSMVVPYGDPAFYEARRSIAIPAPTRDGAGALELDGFFGLHPALEPIAPLWRSRELAVVHAVGSPHGTRSHFQAQDFMETARPGDREARVGWLNRVLSATCDCDGRTPAHARAHSADHAFGQAGLPMLRGVSLGRGSPLALRGPHPTLALRSLDGLHAFEDPDLVSGLTALYGPGTDVSDPVAGGGAEALEAARILRTIHPDRYSPRAGVEYPANEFATSLRDIAQLIKADVGVEVAFAELGGWDTHAGQGGVSGQLAARLGILAHGLRAFHDDLGERMEDVVVLTMSEFGRTIDENGSGGTDHGHANCMLAIGGALRGGRVLGTWPGLAPELRYEGRDLQVTTDFRDVFAEVARTHLGAPSLDDVFGSYETADVRFPGLL